MDFLRKREDFVDLMIKHIGTSAIMDLLLRMLTCIEPQQLRQDVLNVGSSTLSAVLKLFSPIWILIKQFKLDRHPSIKDISLTVVLLLSKHLLRTYYVKVS